MQGSLDDVVAFCRVVETGAFTAAADALGLSKGAVSKAVSRLETRLGVRLLHRTTRRQTLTEAGQQFFARAGRVVGELEEAAREVSEHAGRPRGHLRISAPEFFGAEILSRHLGEFRRRYPDITLEIKHANRFVDLVEERFDAAIRISAPVDSSLVMRKLAEIPMVFCASPEYLLRRGRPETPVDLRDHDCLIYTGSTRPKEWQVLDADGLPEAIAVDGGLHTNNDHTLRQVALDGGGIVRMPRLFLADDLRDGRLVQLWPDGIALPVTLAAVYPSGRDLPRKVRAFIDFLVECRGEWRGTRTALRG